jgi:hypothetical protein
VSNTVVSRYITYIHTHLYLDILSRYIMFKYITSDICFNSPTVRTCGPGSSVGIATDYGLDGPGIESRWGRDFLCLSRPALGPPSLLYNGYWVFPRGKVRPGRAADHSPPSSAEVTEE